MTPLVPRHVDLGEGPPAESQRGVDHGLGFAQVGDDRPVVVGVRGVVQQSDAGRAAHGVDDALHLLPVAALADVGDALHELHASASSRSKTTTPSLTTDRDGVDTPMVRDGQVAAGIQHHHVGPFAHLQAAHLVGQIDGPGRVQRQGAQYLGDRHPHVGGGDGADEEHVLAEAGTGVEVGGEGHGHAGVDESPGGGVGREAQGEDRPRQQDGRDTGGGQRGDAGVADVIQVVGGGGAELGRELGAAARRQLVHVELGPQPMGQPGREHAPGLGRGERPLLHEHVAEPGQPGLRRPRDHLLHHQVDVGLRIGAVLHRHCVGAQQRGHDGLRPGVRQVAADLQETQLVLHRETVAGLHLHGGHAMAEQSPQMAAPAGEELLPRRGAGGPHGVHDAPAGGGDVQVAQPGHSQLEFGGAVAREDRVGVGFHHPGHDHPPGSVQHAGPGARHDGSLKLCIRPQPDDAPAAAARAPSVTIPRSSPAPAQVMSSPA